MQVSIMVSMGQVVNNNITRQEKMLNKRIFMVVLVVIVAAGCSTLAPLHLR